jgi:signal transduction histidine kinase/DNA-binding response OmpR family regulator
MADGRVNILIVDDKPEKVLALEALLEDLGQNVVRAYSGREALRCLLNDEYAVILLDVNMPGMDGFETAALIRQRASTRDVPIIFVTAFGDEAYTARGYELGAVDYIQTPVVPEVLKTKVMVFVDLFKKTEQVRRQAESLRRRASQMQILAAAAVAMSGNLSVERMLQTVSDTARDALGAHQAITVFIDPRPGKQKVQTTASYSDKYADWRGQPLALDAIVDTAVFRSYTATRLSEAELLEHPDWEIVQRVRVPPIRGGMLAAPLTGRDGTRLGVIYVCDRGGDAAFTADDESVAVQLAQMSSIALENALYAQEREANRIKDEFLSTLSHELRTPLNAILGWTQLLRVSPDPGEVPHGLEVIERNARAQAKLIEDLLDVSRITSGKLRLNLRPLRLGEVVCAAVEAVRPLGAEKTLTLVWTGAGFDDTTVGDADRLQQVAWNLLSNAVKFTPPGGRVEVRLEPVNGHLRLQVMDTGKGINPAFLPYVFDRFRQADQSSTRSHGGLGIGLTIVRHIIELHGGEVHAESAGEGRGATFTITLPPPIERPGDEPGATARDRLGEVGAAPAAPPPVVAAAARSDGKLPSLANVRVLVVDDEPDAREVLAHTLGRAGAAVTTCPSVQEAIDTIAMDLPDVIISDIAMPGEDGYDLVRKLRRTVHASRVPAIAITAYAREEDRAKALLAGFERHVAKPIDPVEVVCAVAELLPDSRNGHDAPAATDASPTVSA